MTPHESPPRTDRPVWSAQNLPKTKAPRMLTFSVLAIMAGLVVIVLATAMNGPIQTAGTRMEPARFKVLSQQAGKAATGPAGLVVAAGTP